MGGMLPGVTPIYPKSISICPSIHPSTHPLTYPFTHASGHPFTHPSIHTSILASTHPFTHPSLHPPTRSPIHPLTRLSFPPSFLPPTHPSVHPPARLSIHPPVWSLTHPSFRPPMFPTELLLSGQLSEYGVTVPFSADCRGRFLSHILSGGTATTAPTEAPCPPAPARRRRGAHHASSQHGAGSRPIYFNVTVLGRELHLRLRPNTGLVPPRAVAEWQEDFGLRLRQPLQHHCLFTGDITGVPGGAVAISNCDGLVGMGSAPLGFFVLWVGCPKMKSLGRSGSGDAALWVPWPLG